MSKSEENKANEAQKPHLVFDEKGNFMRMGGLPQNPKKRTAAVEELIEQLGQRYNNFAQRFDGLLSDFEGAGATNQRLNARNAALAREIATLKLSDVAQKGTINSLQAQCRRYSNDNRLIVWANRVNGGYEQLDRSVLTHSHSLHIETGGLRIKLEQRGQTLAALQVDSAPDAAVKLKTQQIILVDGEFSKANFVQLRMLMRAVTPEGKAELLNDPEAPDLFASEPASQASSAQNPQERCMENSRRADLSYGHGAMLSLVGNAGRTSSQGDTSEQRTAQAAKSRLQSDCAALGRIGLSNRTEQQAFTQHDVRRSTAWNILLDGDSVSIARGKSNANWVRKHLADMNAAGKLDLAPAGCLRGSSSHVCIQVHITFADATKK